MKKCLRLEKILSTKLCCNKLRKIKAPRRNIRIDSAIKEAPLKEKSPSHSTNLKKMISMEASFKRISTKSQVACKLSKSLN